MSAPVGLFQHPDCSRHDTGWGHPEHQGRLRAVMSALERALPDLNEHVAPVVPERADLAVLSLAHSPGHVERVRAACEEAAGSGQLRHLDADTVVSPGSWEAALAAAGCGVAAVDAVLDGRYRAAHCAVRPPGHHATRDRAMGFCLFNTVALAARHAQERPGIERVLIVDWDVHHGNGTQDIFYEDPSVFFLSMHQHPLFPGTGMADERGRGEGEGTTLNLPMRARLPAQEYVDALLDGLEEALADFAPDLTLISAGFDAGVEDPLGGFTLSEGDFALLAREVVERTRHTATGRVVSFLEGGYHPAELGRNVVAHLKALAAATGEPTPATGEPTPATGEPAAATTGGPTAATTGEPAAATTGGPTAAATEELTATTTEEPTAAATGEPTTQPTDDTGATEPSDAPGRGAKHDRTAAAPTVAPAADPADPADSADSADEPKLNPERSADLA